MTLIRKLKYSLMMLSVVLLSGTIGFHVLEGWSLFDALYATVSTISTVGYGDYAPATATGRFFAMLLIVFGVGTMLYTAGLYAETMFEGRMRLILGRGKLERTIAKLHNHYIICGCGRIGRLICRELAEAKAPFVVVDNNPEVLQKIEEDGFIYYKGDATDDKTLIGAGIKRAKGIVCVLSTDAENLYVILTAKELNPDLYVLSRSEDEASESRLLRAGADRVMSPYALGGMRMAMAILRPAMLDFIEITARRQNLELQMEELSIGEHAAIIGKSLETAAIRDRFGVIVIAVKKDSGQMIFNPRASYVIEIGDKLIVMGEGKGVAGLAEVCLGS